MKFRFGKCLVLPAIPHGGGEVERPYKMSCETLNVNARKCSETLCVLCISVSRHFEQEKAFCRAKSFSFFHIFLFAVKEKMVASNGAKLYSKMIFHLLKHKKCIIFNCRNNNLQICYLSQRRNENN